MKVKIDRIHGKLWPFPCTAGHTVIVINSKGNLAPCELRSESIDLAEYDYDVGKAMVSVPYQEALDKIRKERCDCTHGCFVGNSLLHSGTYFARTVPLQGIIAKIESHLKYRNTSKTVR